MGKVNVVIIDATGNKENKVGLPDDVKCGIIMVKLVEKIKLPSIGPDGNPISYKFIHKVTGRQLLEMQTLAEAGVKDGDVLRLQPEITAGANSCPYCGSSIMSDNSTFCTTCGKSVVTRNDIVANYIGNSGEKKTKGIFISGIISGVLSSILGLVVMFKDTGVYASMESYGGDAYTGIQHAAARTANNIQDLAEICKMGLGSILIVLGIAIVCYFTIKMKEN